MTIGLNGPVDTRVDDSYRRLRIIWLAILAAVVAAFVVTRLTEANFIGGSPWLFWFFLAIGAANLAVSFYVKQQTLKKAVEAQNLGMAQSAYVVAFAICEAVALLGLVAHLSSGHKFYYFLFVLGGFGVVLHKPQRDDLQAAASGAGGVWEAKRQG